MNHQKAEKPPTWWSSRSPGEETRCLRGSRSPFSEPLPFLLVSTASFAVTFWKPRLLDLAAYHPRERLAPSPILVRRDPQNWPGVHSIGVLSETSWYRMVAPRNLRRWNGLEAGEQVPQRDESTGETAPEAPFTDQAHSGLKGCPQVATGSS